MNNHEEKATLPSSRSRPWYYDKLFKYIVETWFVLAIIVLFYHVASVISPIFNFVTIIIIPIIISILFYYLLRPIVRLMERFKIPRVVTIIFIYLVIALMISLFSAYIVPILGRQVTSLVNLSAEAIQKTKESYRAIMSHIFHINIEYEMEQHLFNFAQQMVSIVSKNVINIFETIARIATVLAVIPFIVFYLLKDDREFMATFFRYLPEDFGREIGKILTHIDATISTYISSLVFVSFTVGTLLFIGYLIIGLNFALVLSLIAIVFMTIPFLGPFLSIAPALLVGLSQGPWMVLNVLIVFIIVQQLEANVLSPQIIGQRLNIHPLTVILLLLAAGSLYGLLGLILVTPAYAVLRVLIENLYKIYKLHRSYLKEKLIS